jgi:hypothetical protein
VVRVAVGVISARSLTSATYIIYTNVMYVVTPTS